MISIKGLCKTTILKKMWERTITARFFSFSGVSPPLFDEKSAEEAVARYIDYFCGRPIKTDLSKDEVDPYLYDRDAGKGTFEQIISEIKSCKSE